MGHKYDRVDADDRDDEEEEEDDLPAEPARQHSQRGSSPMMQILAAIGFIAIGAVVVPALWGLMAEAPSLRRYMRIMRM